ncbi:hypothetical protein G4B84_009430 [Aspergillus flavus NRRL3357]|nr:uncharacterized protein G4B84_009430 [Aspergillus flavus NRRL3357]QMW33964.1 hypothetical protein G4B84_009430 [Aspergillus flavus NRRL3357]QMW46018.1 hypothetical protein G4B11_009473 [Aspergillus flavus]
MDMVKAAYRGQEYDMHFPGAEEEVRATKTILCNGKRLGVTANLYEALLSLRKTRPGNGEYWIDAVGMMGRIYQSADLVLVWLGDCSSKLAQGLPELEALAQRPPRELPPFELLIDDESTSTTAASSAFFKNDRFCISAAAMTVLDLTNRQWFKRIWVLQEFCLAKHVVFLYGKHYVSLQALLTSFIWAYQNPGEAMKPEKGWNIAKTYILPRWFSHTGDIPNVLLARKAIAQGHKLTLREWLLTCKGRSATDPKDFVFGGLSLIYPESLRIDKQRLQPGDYANSTHPPPLPPRPGTRAPNSNQPTMERPTAMVGVSISSVPLPKGLWSVIEIDYKASEAEILVNVAACLLSQNEPHSLDLLSIAARPRDADDLLKAPLKCKSSKTYDLPSWVPALGSWTSLVNSNLAAAAVAAGGGGTAFAAGTLGQLQEAVPSPTISRDGTTLYLDAMPLDKIDEIILNAKFSYSKEHLDALIPFSNYSVMDGDVNRSSSSLPPQLLPRVWLCEIIEREVRLWVTVLRIDIKAFTVLKKIRANKRRRLESLLAVYRQLIEKFDDLPWSGTADQGIPPPDESHGDEQKKRRSEEIIESLCSKIEERIPRQSRRFLEAEMEPISPEAQRYENAFYSAMNWRSLFRTKDGLIGMGPSWLSCGDWVMPVRGAIVPYVFRHIDEDLKQQVKSLGNTVEKLEKHLFELKSTAKRNQQRLSIADTERKIASLKQKIGELCGQVGRKNAWVLIGEAYVEGVMRGEALERAGFDAFERIAIV